MANKESRQTPLTVYLEPTLWALLQNAVMDDNTTASSYIRNLIITDLKRRGILSDQILMAIVTGDGLEAIYKSLSETARI